jgi:hypothetical protein
MHKIALASSPGQQHIYPVVDGQEPDAATLLLGVAHKAYNDNACLLSLQNDSRVLSNAAVCSTASTSRWYMAAC